MFSSAPFHQHEKNDQSKYYEHTIMIERDGEQRGPEIKNSGYITKRMADVLGPEEDPCYYCKSESQ